MLTEKQTPKIITQSHYLRFANDTFMRALEFPVVDEKAVIRAHALVLTLGEMLKDGVLAPRTISMYREGIDHIMNEIPRNTNTTDPLHRGQEEFKGTLGVVYNAMCEYK